MDAKSQDARTTMKADPDGSDGEYDAHLDRSQRMWDRWSDWYSMSERDFEPIREELIDQLALTAGDRVLDIGCGPGVNFTVIREAIGEDGRLAAVDYSPEMVAKARERVERNGWENVEVRCADATTVDFDEQFDAAVATLSMSVMPDVRQAVENVYGLLVPGGSFAVLDVGTVSEGPLRVLNPLIWRFFRWYANWNPDGDVPEALGAVFDECEAARTYMLGVSYTRLCTKQ